MGDPTNGFDESSQQTDVGVVIRSGREILLQAFNWESHKHDWWDNLENKVPDVAISGFTSAWLPPATHSCSPEGYLPQNLYSLDSSYGSELQLKALLQKMKQYKVRAMADIVINHRVGTTIGHGGTYNRYDGIPLPWDEHAVTCCTGGLGNKSSGDNFDGVPNIDHTQDFVRKDIIGWLKWLRNTVGFQDFRFDFARGYSAKYVKEYIEGAKPVFSVGEYWDSCNYNGQILDCNQDGHRQRIVNWIDGTGQLSTAFDFTTKGILQEAVKGELWRLRDPQGKPPGAMGLWPSRAVTFIDNHDTGSTQGYAYILTHPGIPTVFYDHFYDWDNAIHDEIVKLMDIRKHQDIHSRSSIRIIEAQPNLYSAIIGEKLSMKIGDGSWCPSGREWSLVTSGHGYAVWHK
ncbi:probable alpha-amylase 2 isoform X2 [Camellia sinensis]|uniref:probable alpha-amylase 2 isoform X2 n=1 Tax=Camellia sinensis TaxID=4442 RepID=UPI00103572DB|nr:probable alpha-amylase 2 isoform X2 [Camellia sinensis]